MHRANSCKRTNIGCVRTATMLRRNTKHVRAVADAVTTTMAISLLLETSWPRANRFPSSFHALLKIPVSQLHQPVNEEYLVFLWHRIGLSSELRQPTKCDFCGHRVFLKIVAKDLLKLLRAIFLSAVGVLMIGYMKSINDLAYTRPHAV